MKRFGWALALCASMVSVALYADSLAINFETYSPGAVNGQDGWQSTGPYDREVVVNSTAPASFGTQSLRVSNAVASGSFGDQTFSKSLVNEAGETAASNGGMSGGVRQPHFDVQWDTISTLPNVQQPGLLYTVSPDRGDGARMSYLRVEDGIGGLDVYFVDVQGTVPCGVNMCGNFVTTPVATSLDRTVPHTLGLSLDLFDGTSNDVVNVSIDGVIVHTGTTWEDYYAFDPESADGSPSRTVDSILIRFRRTSTKRFGSTGRVQQDPPIFYIKVCLTERTNYANIRKERTNHGSRSRSCNKRVRSPGMRGSSGQEGHVLHAARPLHVQYEAGDG